ncbi:helix-turn-helix domain-containing protein [Streptomyces sp. ME18-1-4]|uniref:TetR/AcrR family transcriptional regulator n=1 Tax=Streptomyces sp. ME18-1-4 TaxID=3028685 RepID=UPI0029BC9AFC|nr:helix-turn-helix domain-containing protein [Streptomyces sp. ME18-1-4]MDX3245416.1 helix-turn-helix domain containing protein [Streptomyces sp. ME18-1-4]
MTGSPKGGARAAKAAVTRERMLKAARKLFTEGGYTATTMQAIAAEAGVAVQTLYFTFETKRAILKELLDVEIAGDTLPIASLERPWVDEALAAPPAEMLRLLAVKTAEIHARVATVLDVVRSAAATDPEIAELWRTNITQRHTVVAVFTGALAAKGGLRPGVSPLRAADTALAIMTPETYLFLTRDRSWSNKEWADWAADALASLLLE